MKKIFYKLFFASVFWLLAAGIVSAQSIDAAEYFFDTDPGIGNGIALSVSPGDTIRDTLFTSTAGLNPGFHNVFFRVKDTNGVWSLYEGDRFYIYDTIAQTLPSFYPIAKAEYFFDTDPGIGNGIAISNFSTADSILLNDTLPTAPLTAGTHNLFVRVHDTLNVWSLYEGRSFIICNFIPVANFKADTVCIGSQTTFTDLSTNLDTTVTYAWDFNNDGIIDDTTKGNTTWIFPSPGTHTVTLVVNNTTGCLDTVIKTIYVDSLPIVTLNFPIDTICKDDTLQLSGGNPAGGAYSGVGVYNGSFYADSVSAGNHTVYYTYYNMDSCSATASNKIFVGLCTGVNELQGSGFRVQVSPNPFRETTKLKITSEKQIPNCELLVYTIVGERINIESNQNAEGFVIHRGNLVQGIYFYKIISEKKIIGTGKLVIAD